MSIEPQFLSFKGLKQYTPEDGWAEVNAMLNSRAHAPTGADTSHAAHAASPHSEPPLAASPSVHHAMPNISLDLDLPTLTETAEPPAPAARASDKSAMFDPLISELVDQLKVPPTDELTQTWRTIAAEVNLLTQRMALQRELQERLSKLDLELTELRGTIMSHLRDVQQAADQQLTSARLRAEVSALAQTKLTAKLNRRT